ncbi:TetR/AcrR family transcriptional regulator [Dactylosporangium sp. NPDC051485]|uniref:TetR/AcrR family transcriptional regulator n=1 Tax=Dactylosporangium sp. NPDC051485 TaxID=3154846 RepID=UPI0034161B6D
MSASTASRGRIDKREAILDAAFTVFSAQGYERASVQEIADVAGVAKPTVYKHLQDKEDLFLQAMAGTAEAVLAENLAALDRLRNPGDDLRAAMEEAAYGMLLVCCNDRSRALRYLTFAEISRFPDLIDLVPGRTSGRLSEAIADRFARLAVSGYLRPCDPVLAAEQFLGLLTVPAEERSRMGTRKVPAAEVRTISTAAVDTFLRAYATATGETDGGRQR